MNRQEKRRHLWAWNLSALFYEWSYIRVAHQTDTEFLHYLGERVVGATVADCGCGPGVVAEKILAAGAALVVAIDANANMVGKAKARLAKAIATGQALVWHASHEGDTLACLCQKELEERGFDIILFKRSLYMPRPRALVTLRHAAATLRAKGMMVVVHPERSLVRYAFGPPVGIAPYTLFHLCNRALSRVAEWCGMEEYTLYSRHELLALLHEAVPEARVELIPSHQRPYNLAVLQVP
jgi:2-polyprenyl-3-methyl-5-hydroxy-6-metoxy-1,4-benzoquinol methylase